MIGIGCLGCQCQVLEHIEFVWNWFQDKDGCSCSFRFQISYLVIYFLFFLCIYLLDNLHIFKQVGSFQQKNHQKTT